MERNTRVPKFRVAIASDLHCHSLRECSGRQESGLIAGLARHPASQHPVQALLEMIDREKLMTDLLVCPGDLAHKVSSIGFEHAWFEMRSLRDALGASDLLGTLGNHDVSSRSNRGDPFFLAKSSHSDFPLSSSQNRDHFWLHGYTIYPTSSHSDVVVLNTAFHHFSESEAVRGTFPDERIDSLQATLSKLPNPGMRMALMHHHPILHSFPGSPSVDVLPNGDRLLNVLGCAGCTFIVHGHRHQPRLSRHCNGGQLLLVLAAGSFSRNLGADLSSVTRNLFHIVDWNQESDLEPWGTIRTWEFRWGQGWKPASAASAGFPYTAGFGPASVLDIERRLIAYLNQMTQRWIPFEDLVNAIPDLIYLIPDELNNVLCSIESNGEHRFMRDEFGDIAGVGKLHDHDRGA